MPKRICLKCGKEFEVSEQSYIRGYRLHCSDACKHADLRVYYTGRDGTEKFTYKSTRKAQKNRAVSYE